MRKLSLPFIALLALVTAALAACSSGPSDDTCQVEPAEEVLAQSRAAMREVERFQFSLTHPEGATAVGGGLTVRRADGAVIGSERLQLEAEADFGRLFVRVEAIVIDGQTWMTNPLTGNWGEIEPEESPFGFLDPPVVVANILGEVSEVCYFESDQSDDSTVITGKVASEALAPLVGAVAPGSVLDVRLTFDSETSRLTVSRIAGKLQDEDEESFVRLIELSGFGSNITIEPPS